MTYTVHETKPLYAAVTTLLAGTGKSVGQAQRPEAGVAPYMVLYPLPDTRNEGGLSDPHQIAVQTFQVTCVGDTMAEAQWMQAKAREALLGVTPAFTGATPIELQLGSGVLRDDDGVVFYTTDRFTIYVS